jgi:hypothetical protein
MLSGSVIQDCYNVVMTAYCVESLLCLTIPNYYNKDGSSKEQQ